jgi:pilus assembly protein CpaB
MSAKTILTFLFLTSLGVAVFVCLRALPQRPASDGAAPTDEVLVATTVLASGTLLRRKDIAWQSNPGKIHPDQIERSPAATNNANSDLTQQAGSEVYGAALRIGVRAGEPIPRSAIAKPGDRDFLQVVLSPGARAIAIPVATSGASTGLLYPGDHVDVILTQTFKNDPPLTRRSVSETVVESLRVLSVDPGDAKSPAAANGFGRSVILEVTPEQAEKINVATELGKLSLTLRSSSATASVVSTTKPQVARTDSVKPTWAGDVSPALGDAVAVPKAIAAEKPAVEVIHGTKSVAVKPQ